MDSVGHMQWQNTIGGSFIDVLNSPLNQQLMKDLFVVGLTLSRYETQGIKQKTAMARVIIGWLKLPAN
ncbi:MAG: hypothetical protein IPI23_16115 [Bacteroidetes bacterium]|nr:hypothetical protein [Bacteroidota bacterium]